MKGRWRDTEVYRGRDRERDSEKGRERFLVITMLNSDGNNN